MATTPADTIGLTFKNGSETLVVERLNRDYPEALVDCRNADGSESHIFTTVTFGHVLANVIK